MNTYKIYTKNSGFFLGEFRAINTNSAMKKMAQAQGFTDLNDFFETMKVGVKDIDIYELITAN